MPILKRSSLVEVNMTIHRLSEIEITRWSSYAAASRWSERLRQLSKLSLTYRTRAVFWSDKNC